MVLNKGFLTFSFSLSLKLVFYLTSVSCETDGPESSNASCEKAGFKFS